MEKKTLVIIDMQDDFIRNDIDLMHNDDGLVDNTLELVRHAINNRWPIVVVEFSGFGPTDNRIRFLLECYKNTETVSKCNMDGWGPVDCCLEENDWPRDLVVCGIYGDACVPYTVMGLVRNSGDINVVLVEDAIYPPYNDDVGYTHENDEENVYRISHQVNTEDITGRVLC